METVRLPVEQVLPHRWHPPRRPPARLRAECDEPARDLGAQPRHLGRGGETRQVLERGPEGPQDRIVPHGRLHLDLVAQRQMHRIHCGGGQFQSRPQFRLRAGLGAVRRDVAGVLLAVVVVHRPLRHRALGRRQQPIRIVAVRMRQHDQSPEVGLAQIVQPSFVQADLLGPGDDPGIDRLRQQRIVAHRRRTVERRNRGAPGAPHRRGPDPAGTVGYPSRPDRTRRRGRNRLCRTTDGTGGALRVGQDCHRVGGADARWCGGHVRGDGRRAALGGIGFGGWGGEPDSAL